MVDGAKTVMAVAAIFKSQLLEMAAARKIKIYLCKIEVAGKIKHAVTT